MKDQFLRTVLISAVLFFLCTVPVFQSLRGDELREASRKLMLSTCKHPHRIIDGKTESLAPIFEFVRTDGREGEIGPDWKLIYGKVIQITENDGILLRRKEKAYWGGHWWFSKIDDPPLVRIQHYPGESQLVDGNTIVAFAKENGSFRYRTTSGSVSTVESFDFGLLPPPEKTQRLEKDDDLRDRKAKEEAAQVRERREAITRETKEKFLEIDRKKAEQNYKVGMAFLNGEGVQKNEAEGIRYLKLSAKQGHAGAIAKLKEISTPPPVQ